MYFMKYFFTWATDSHLENSQKVFLSSRIYFIIALYINILGWVKWQTWLIYFCMIMF